MHVAGAEAAAARNPNSARAHHGYGARAAAVGTIRVAVFVTIVVRTLASMLPLELATQPLCVLGAQRACGVLAVATALDGSALVGVWEDVDVITLEYYLFARHLFVGDAR